MKKQYVEPVVEIENFEAGADILSESTCECDGSWCACVQPGSFEGCPNNTGEFG